METELESKRRTDMGIDETLWHTLIAPITLSFSKQKIRNNWRGVANPECQSSGKAPRCTVLRYQFISSQLTLGPIKKFIRLFFWREPCPCSTMAGYIWRWSFCPNISHFTAWPRPMEKACVAWIFGTSQSSVLLNVLVPETLNHKQFRWWITWDSWHRFVNSTKKVIVWLVAIHGPDIRRFSQLV